MEAGKSTISVKHVYMVRCIPTGINKEIDFLNGTLSVGWPCLGDLTGKDKNEVEKIFYENYSKDFTQLYNFITIPIGSIVLTPSTKNRDIHIFQTTSDYIYNEEQEIENHNVPNPLEKGNPHQLHATLLKTVSRDVFYRTLKGPILAARRPVTNLSKYADRVELIVNDDTTKPTKIPNNYKDEAIETLANLLNSEDENIRLQAALNLLKIDKGGL